MILSDISGCLSHEFSRDMRDDALLVRGDCLDVMKDIPDNSVHLIVTDPPYFLDGFDDKWDIAKLKKKRSKAGVIGGLPVGMKFDKKQGIKLQEFFSKFCKHATRVLCPGAFLLSFSSPRLFHRMAIAADDSGFEVRDMFVWRYRNSQGKAFSQNHFVRKMAIDKKSQDDLIKSMGGRKTPQIRPGFDPILLAQNPRCGTFTENWAQWGTGLVDTALDSSEASLTTVFDVEKPRKSKDNVHLTVKPVSLIDSLIRIFSKKDQVVLDPFVGSGTTLIAARNAGRLGIGIEINPDYYDIAMKRIDLGV